MPPVALAQDWPCVAGEHRQAQGSVERLAFSQGSAQVLYLCLQRILARMIVAKHGFARRVHRPEALAVAAAIPDFVEIEDRKSTRLISQSLIGISYALFFLKKKTL